MITNSEQSKFDRFLEVEEAVERPVEDYFASNVEGLLIAPIGEDAGRDREIEAAWQSLDDD